MLFFAYYWNNFFSRKMRAFTFLLLGLLFLHTAHSTREIKSEPVKVKMEEEESSTATTLNLISSTSSSLALHVDALFREIYVEWPTVRATLQIEAQNGFVA
jgi:hypothetical protein